MARLRTHLLALAVLASACAKGRSDVTPDAADPVDAADPADADPADAPDPVDAPVDAPASPDARICTTLVEQTGALVAGATSTLVLSATASPTASFSTTAPPPGLTVQADGHVMGAPTLSGPQTFPVTVAWDGGACEATVDVEIEVGCPSQTVEPPALRGFVGEAFPQLTHTGAVGASTFEVTAGAWPSGITLAADGTTSGGAAAQWSEVTVKATDAAGCSATRAYEIPVCQTPNLPVPSTWTLSNYYTGDSPEAGGWINGLNLYLDKEKAAYLDFSGTPSVGGVTEVYIGFGQAATNDPSRVLTVRVYDGTSGTPGAVLGQTTITMAQVIADVTAGVYTDVTLPTTMLPASRKFFVAVDVTGLVWNATTKDMLSIVSNSDGQTSPSAIWERQSDNAWYRYGTAGSWNLAASLLVHPVECTLDPTP